MKITQLFFIISFILNAQIVLGQTNKNIFEQYAHEIYQSTTWGMATNGIQFGIRLCTVGPTLADKFKICSSLCNTSSASAYGLWKLAPGYRLTMILKAKDGEEILKTSEGKALCKSPPGNLRSNGRIVILDPNDPVDFDKEFDLRDCFKIKKAGSYILTVKAMLYAIKDDGFTKLDIPEVSIEVVLKDSDLKN